MIENGIVKQQGPKISENDRLSFAVFLAVAFHAMLFIGIVFTLPDKNSQKATPTMQVVLAQYHAVEKPEKADFKGQDNQQGGGDKDVLQTPTTTELAQIPDPSRQASISTAEAAAVQEIKPQPDLLTGIADTQIFIQEQIDSEKQGDQPLMDTATLIQKSYQLAGLTAQLDDSHQLASKNLRKRQVSAAIHRATDALYLDTWRRRIEEVGNRYYPEQAKRKKLYGDLILKVSVNADGTIRDINVMESSGHKILDDAAISIVRRAAPFAPFDETLKKDTDVLEIVRLWQFQPGDIMATR